MILKITISVPHCASNRRSDVTIYTHPAWTQVLNRLGEPLDDYRVVFLSRASLTVYRRKPADAEYFERVLGLNEERKRGTKLAYIRSAVGLSEIDEEFR